MREVEASRFVRASPAVVQRALTPAAVVAYEGSFEAADVEETDGGTLVTATGGGIGLRLRFQDREDGLYYAQEGEAGPFEAMETRITVAPEDEGSRVSARSTVSLGLPFSAVTDGVAAWKRRGELERALGALAADVE